MERAMRLLSLRARTSCELRQKLLRAGFPPDEVDQAVAECEKRHYLDDRLFAEDCTGLWLERGHGARSIRCKLRQKGIGAETAAAALGQLEEREPEAACRAIEGKVPALLREKDPRKRRAKALRFLAGRGFSGNALNAAMKHLAAALKDAGGADGELPPEE
jgi:regulatory protein